MQRFFLLIMGFHLSMNILENYLMVVKKSPYLMVSEILLIGLFMTMKHHGQHRLMGEVVI